MRWRTISQYAIESDKGYKVAKFIDDGVVSYEAFAPDNYFMFFHMGHDHQEAMQACEVHYREKQKKQQSEQDQQNQT